MSLELLNPHVRHARRHMSKFAVRRGVSICYDARLFYFENTEGSLSVGDVKYNISNKTGSVLPALCRIKRGKHDKLKKPLYHIFTLYIFSCGNAY